MLNDCLLTRWPAAWFVPMLLAALTVAGSLVGGCSPNITQDSVKDIPLAQVRKRIDEQAASKSKDVLVLIDARSAKAFAAGHIPDARNMNLGDFPDRLDRRGELDRRIERFEYKVIYGEDRGSAPAQAMVKRLLGLGYGDVYMFMGGMEEWRAANLPVVEGDAKAAGDAGVGERVGGAGAAGDRPPAAR